MSSCINRAQVHNSLVSRVSPVISEVIQCRRAIIGQITHTCLKRLNPFGPPLGDTASPSPNQRRQAPGTRVDCHPEAPHLANRGVF